METYCAWGLLLAGVIGCGGGSGVDLGREPNPGGVQYGDGFGNAGDGAGGALGLADGALNVHVEDDQGLTIEFVTLSCDGACADIVAVASGGNPPYSYAWDDGSADPARTVCLDASTTLRVDVEDAGLDTVEFQQETMAASAEVSAEVIACGGGPLCLENPSFEGTPAPNLFSFDAPPWVSCPGGTADIVTTGTLAPIETQGPSDGNTYLRVVQDQDVIVERASEALCAPLAAGVPASVLFDVSYGAGQGEPYGAGKLQFWGGTAECDQGELLFESQWATPEWTTMCATLVPGQQVTHLTLVPYVERGGSIVYVDNLRPTERCP